MISYMKEHERIVQYTGEETVYNLAQLIEDIIGGDGWHAVFRYPTFGNDGQSGKDHDFYLLASYLRGYYHGEPFRFVMQSSKESNHDHVIFPKLRGLQETVKWQWNAIVKKRIEEKQKEGVACLQGEGENWVSFYGTDKPDACTYAGYLLYRDPIEEWQKDVYIKLENGVPMFKGRGADVILALCDMLSSVAIAFGEREKPVAKKHEEISNLILAMMQRKNTEEMLGIEAEA